MVCARWSTASGRTRRGLGWAPLSRIVRSRVAPRLHRRVVNGTRPFHGPKAAALPLLSLSGNAAHPRPNYGTAQGRAVTVNNSLIPLAETGVNASLAADVDRWVNSRI